MYVLHFYIYNNLLVGLCEIPGSRWNALFEQGCRITKTWLTVSALFLGGRHPFFNCRLCAYCKRRFHSRVLPKEAEEAKLDSKSTNFSFPTRTAINTAAIYIYIYIFFLYLSYCDKVVISYVNHQPREAECWLLPKWANGRQAPKKILRSLAVD